MTNQSGISPTEYNVLVKPEKVEEKTAGGVIMVDTTLDRKQAFETRGVLIAVSPLAFTYETWPEGTRIPQVGDRVITTKAAGVVVKGEDGEDYRLLKDKDICAVVEDMAAKLKALDEDIADANKEVDESGKVKFSMRVSAEDVVRIREKVATGELPKSVLGKGAANV